ncbi:MAG: PAS domain S-box protein [Verrucomicrobia bacterium]|nr:PAS domain S-box protein [Verrucomicrobiota bacterium]
MSSSDTETRTVLIIEDSSADRLMYRKFIGQLTAFNKRFLEEESGLAGLQRYSEETIDCILLDLHLPDMNGVEFLGQFREKHGDNVCPIIMLTGQGSEEDAVMALKAGAHDYLSKIRLTPENLNRAVENAIEKVNLHKRLENQRLDLKVKNNQLQVMKDHLEKLVEERTRNLIVTNERLLVEIEERRKAESQVRESARFNRMIMDAAPAFIAYVDENDCYRFANLQYQRVFRCKEEDILGISLTDHVGNAFEDERNDALQGNPQDFEYHHITSDGDQGWYHILLTPHTSPYGELLGYFMVGIDVSEKREAEEALTTQAQLIDQSLNAIISTTEEGIIRTWNEGAERIFKIPYEQAIGQHISFMYAPGDDRLFENQILAPLQEKQQMEADLVFMDGQDEPVQVHALFSLLKDIDGNQQGIVGYYLDNTARLKTERSLQESEAKFSALFRDAATGIILSDLNGKIADCNLAFGEILGLNKKDVIGKTIENFYLPGEEEEEFEYLNDCQKGKRTSYQIDKQLKAEDGRTIWGRITTSMILGQDREPNFIVRMLEDITRQKENEAFIQKSLEEKQVLLREVHHRVKNNLQVIQSLLRMQSRKAKDSSMEPLLRESQNRIRSIALIHEQLYKQDDFSEIDLANYLNLLLRQVFRTFELGSLRVTSRVEFKNIYLSLNKAIPCALIINELVTNSLKYAFNGKDTGEIRIQAEQENGTLTLVVRDDGCGIGDSVDIDTSETLGLKIVRTLTRQIGGTLEISNQDGTHFKLTFEPGRDHD